MCANSYNYLDWLTDTFYSSNRNASLAPCVLKYVCTAMYTVFTAQCFWHLKLVLLCAYHDVAVFDIILLLSSMWVDSRNIFIIKSVVCRKVLIPWGCSVWHHPVTHVLTMTLQCDHCTVFFLLSGAMSWWEGGDSNPLHHHCIWHASLTQLWGVESGFFSYLLRYCFTQDQVSSCSKLL